MTKQFAVRLAAVACVALLVTGCGDSSVDTYPAKGTLKIKGVDTIPSGITLTLIPASGSSDLAISAPVNEDGSFEFGTHDPGDGAPEGDYKVVVNVKAMSDKRPADASPESMMKWQAEQMAAMKLVDAKYKDPTKSPLSVKITTDGNTSISLELDEAVDTGTNIPGK